MATGLVIVIVVLMRDNRTMHNRDELRVGVVGVGSFGRNHARVYRDLQNNPSQKVRLVGVVDSDFSLAQSVAKEFATSAFRSIPELIQVGVQAASVAVPTAAHLEVASQLMEKGVDVLVEKPLAATVSEADEMIGLAERYGCMAQVGHLERFNPAVRATLPLLTQPMFFEVHRLSVFTPRSLDVDVVLDLMIHDIDIVLTFAKSAVKEVRAVGLPILSAKTDIANVRMEFESGCVANFTASRVSTERVRKLRFFQPRQYVSIDYSRQDVLVLTIDDVMSAPAALDPFNPANVAASAFPGITPFKPAVEVQEPLSAELTSFLRAVRGRSTPEVTLEDGRRALAVATRVVEAIAKHSRHVRLPELTRADS
ncbi:MAG TPA: Gfo/Idh/MocA family oxidoreductase [Terriglobales bacterium]|nr:Gfo/Idh/MocA family oxidoreductase [Terriglobales bacterium]